MQAVGRYVMYGELASGGMASVHIGRLVGPEGFSRAVAIKRLHPHLAKDPEFRTMFLDEARLAARIRHPNVVPTIDVVTTEGELFLVMEYVHGESLARLIRAAIARGEAIAPGLAAAVVADVLVGLHAAHSLTDAKGRTLDVVHRDVSPQNVLVGLDGTARVLDFGVAKTLGRIQTTRDGRIKGKLGYMAPEQLDGTATRATDIYAASVVLWEMLTGRRLYLSNEQAHVIKMIAAGDVKPPSAFVTGLPAAIDDVVMRGLAKDPSARFDIALDMATALRAAVGEAAAPRDVTAWVEALAAQSLAERAAQIAEIDSRASVGAIRAATQPGGASSAREPGQATVTMEFDASPGAMDTWRASTVSSLPSRGIDHMVSASPRSDPRRAGSPREGARRRRPVVLVAGALAALAAGSVVAARLATRANAVTSVPATALSETKPMPSASAPLVVESASPPPSSPAPSSTTPPMSGTAVAPAPKRKLVPSPAHPPKVDCNPPYREVVVGSNIRRVPKPECL
jgi:serine/threonine-protein kinase